MGEAPTTWLELNLILQERYRVLGGGTEQSPVDLNDIDVSGMTHITMMFSGRMHFKYIDIRKAVKSGFHKAGNGLDSIHHPERI